MSAKPIFLVTATLLLLASVASAHTAAPPRGHEVRLLHDCNDDYFGSDAIGGRDGHELHALDLYEAWDEQLGNIVVFRVTMAGEGAGAVELALKAGSSSKNYGWSTQGSSWTGTGFDKTEGPFQATKADGTADGDRFVLQGIVKQSKLGSLGTMLSDYSMQSSVDGDEADSMPGYDGGITGSCSDDFKRPDYALAGPVQFASLAVEESDVTLPVGQEVFVQVTVSNLLRDQAQRITIAPSDATGVQVEMHNPTTDAYTDELTLDLNKKGGAGDAKIAHVAITGKQGDASGTITVEMTTDGGGRAIKTIAYAVAPEAMTSNPSSTTTTDSEQDAPDNDAPALSVVLLVLALVALAARRR